MMNDEQLKALRASEPQPSWLNRSEMATEPQQGYIARLIERHAVPENWLLRIKELAESEQLTKRKASEIIRSLQALPYKPDYKGKMTTAQIPPGYYAYPIEGAKEGGNDIAFFRIWKPDIKASQFSLWAIYGPNEERLQGRRAMQVLDKIWKYGLGESAVLYGKKTGRCSQCRRRLTNRVSRELSIGPVCGGRVYSEDWQERVNNAREAIVARGEDPDEKIES